MSKKIDPFVGKISQDPMAGLGNTMMEEEIPEHIDAASEITYKGHNNTFIILGRDRQHGTESGYGGKGHTRSGAIDIVAGLQGWNPKSEMYGGKSFGSMNTPSAGDAARIYISQRTDIDDYFDICGGSVGSPVAVSAIALKADEVRILARRGMKLVTGKSASVKTSSNGEIPIQFGIDLIAGNNDKNGYLQPIPKGDNLRSCLFSVYDSILQLNGIVSNLVSHQVAINSAVAGSVVTGTAGPFPVAAGIVNAPIVIARTTNISTDCLGELIKQQKVIGDLKTDFLNDLGDEFINSHHNRTN